MAETSKNKIYYNDNENSVADVLADMKKMAESTDEAIEKSKYNDTQTKKDISNIQKEQTTQNTDISNIKKEQETQNTNIEENNNKIVELQTEKAKLETELKEAQEDFYQNSIRGQASGEYIHVEDSSNCRSIIGIGGNHEQETREGYNLLDLTSLIGKTETKNGITYKINEDCSITVNGTPTGYTSFILLNMSLKAGTYKFVDGITNNNVFLQTIGDFQHTSQNNTFSLAEDGKATVYLVIRTGAPTLNNVTLYPMIYEGTEDKPYEQYGAMPSPDYPSSIVAVGSNVNLCNGVNQEYYLNIYADLCGVISGNTGLIIPITEEKYTISTQISQARYRAACIKEKPIENSSVKAYNGVNKDKTSDNITINTSGYAYLIINATDLTKIKIEKGTVATPWSPYGMGSVGIDLVNKNLLNIANTEKTTKGGITYSIKNGILKLNGTATASFDIQLSKNIKIKKGKYTHSSSYIQLGLYISFNNLGYTIISAQVGKKRTFEITEDTTYKSYFIWIDKGTVLNNVEIKLQLEAGTTVTDFIEHQSQSVIMPVQKEMLEGDYVADVEHHEWKKLTLTGNENIKLNTAFANVFNIEIPKINIMNQQVCLCNIAKGVVYNTALFTIQDNIIMTASLNKIVYKSTKFSSLSEFKTYLQNQYEEGTPVIVYYKLAEPINLELTDEQKAVAKELTNARTYKNVTNITTDSKAILSLDYVKDQETQNQKMQNEIDEIKQLLSTTQTSALLLDNLQKEVESEVE